MTETTVMQKPATGRPPRLGAAMILTLALLSAIAPFATDLYLSAFPMMTEDLSTSATGVQLSLTTFLVGAGVGQLIFGPLSDRLGRRGLLFIGLVIYLAASIASALAPTASLLVIARFIQGLSGAAGMVLSRAIISDLTRGAAAARALSVMMLVSSIAPIIAPFVGSLLVDRIGWRGLLGIVAALGLISIALVIAFVRETRAPQRADTAADAKRSHGRLLSVRYIGYTLAYAFAFSTMMAYISASPFIYQNMIGMTEVEYGLMFALNAITMAATGAVSAKLVGRYRATQLVHAGLVINLGAIAVLVALVLSPAPAIWLAAPLLVAVASMGLILGNTTALALDAVPGRGGSASAWLGCLQFVLAGAVSSIVGLGGESTAVPLALTMLTGSIIAAVAFTVARRTSAAAADAERQRGSGHPV